MVNSEEEDQAKHHSLLNRTMMSGIGQPIRELMKPASATGRRIGFAVLVDSAKRSESPLEFELRLMPTPLPLRSFRECFRRLPPRYPLPQTRCRRSLMYARRLRRDDKRNSLYLISCGNRLIAESRAIGHLKWDRPKLAVAVAECRGNLSGCAPGSTCCRETFRRSAPSFR